MGGHGRYRVFRRIRTIRITVAGFVEREVDLGETEAGDRHIETQVDQALEFDREDLAVPASIQRELVVGEDIGPSFGLGQMRERDRRHRLHAEQASRLDPTMAGNDLAFVRHQHRVREAEAFDAVGDLSDLFLGVCARIARVRFQRRNATIEHLIQMHGDPP